MASPDAHLIVDGYNVIHALDDYRCLLPASLDLACSRLVEAVRAIHDAEALAITTVFDGRGNEVTIERPGNVISFSVVYSPSHVSADGVIEQIVRRAKRPQEVTVASRDNLVGESVRSAGGICISPEELADWIGRAENRLRRMLEARRAKHKRQEKAGPSPWDELGKLRLRKKER
ncbi:MAG: NYN domain-containing protein [Opitutales bacterium]